MHATRRLLNGVADQYDAPTDLAALSQTSVRMAEGKGFLWDHAASDLRSDLAEADHLLFVDCWLSGDVKVSAHHPGVVAAPVEPFDGPRADRSPAALWVPVVYEVQSGP